MAEDAVSPEIYRRIVGYEKVTDLFGYWPGFEEAEILGLQMARQGSRVSDGPTVIMRLLAFEWGHDAASGRTVIDHRCVVTMRFSDVDELHVTGLNFQNAIHELKLGVENHALTGRLTVHFPAARGLTGSFSCWSAEVVAVRPGEPLEDDFIGGLRV